MRSQSTGVTVLVFQGATGIRAAAAAHKVAKDTPLARRLLYAEYCNSQRLPPHPAILRPYACLPAAAAREAAVLTFPLCRGGTLARCIQTWASTPSAAATIMPVAVALSIASDVLSPLRHMHGHGLAHRDLKPENILFRDARLSHLVIADLGIAAPFGTPIVSRIGTRGYRPAAVEALPQAPPPRTHTPAPQIPTDACLDVFSVAVIIVQLCTGWRAPDVAALAAAEELEQLLAIFLDDALAAALCDGLAPAPAHVTSAAALQRAVSAAATGLSRRPPPAPGITRDDLGFLQRDALRRAQHAQHTARPPAAGRPGRAKVSAAEATAAMQAQRWMCRVRGA